MVLRLGKKNGLLENQQACFNGPEGIRTIANFPGKTKVLKTGGTESGTLDELIALWDALSGDQKRAIFRIVRAGGTGP